MASKKISELSAASALDGTEDIPLVQGGQTRQANASAIKTYLNGAASTWTAAHTFSGTVSLGGNVSVTATVELAGSSVTEPALVVYSDYATASRQANITSITYGVSGGGTFHANHANGTRATPSATLAGDITGGIGSRAYHSGGAFQASSPASIHWRATENQTSAAYGMGIRFLTTPQGSTTRHERGWFTDVGTLWVHDHASDGTYNYASTAQTRPVPDALFVASASGTLAGASYAAVGYGDGPVTAGFRGMVARGTPGTPTATQSGDILAFLGGHGYGATGFSATSKGLLAVYAAENWTDSNQGTYIALETTPTGSTTRAEAFRIDPNGFLVATIMLEDHADDAAAASGGVPVGGFYHNSGAVRIRRS